MARNASSKTISLIVDHVHMPVDLLTSKWAEAQDTRRYEAKSEPGADGKRKHLKYDVHHALAGFLIDREQAIEVPADEEPGE